MNAVAFFDLQKELFQLFSNGNYEGVHAIIRQVQEQFPERKEKTYFWKACAYSVQGNEVDAIAALKEGLEEGIWWNPNTLTRDPDLKNLQDLPEFKSVLQRCEDLLKSEQISTPQLFTYGNSQSDIGLFSLHWRGSNVEDFAPFWLDKNQSSNFCIGFPQSSQAFGYHSYCWDDPQIALNDLYHTFNEYKNTNQTTNDILTGASQGGKLSMELSIANQFSNFKGFIAVIPAIQDVDAIDDLLKQNQNTNLKGCIITGDQDPFYDKTVALLPIFEKYDLPCKLIVVEGLGHFFPENFLELLDEAVDFILE